VRAFDEYGGAPFDQFSSVPYQQSYSSGIDLSPQNYLNGYAQAGSLPPPNYYPQIPFEQMPRMIQIPQNMVSNPPQTFRPQVVTPIAMVDQQPALLSSKITAHHRAKHALNTAGHLAHAQSKSHLPRKNHQPSFPKNPTPGKISAGPVLPLYVAPKAPSAADWMAPTFRGSLDESRDPKIVAALDAVMADLVAKGRTVTAEEHWTKEVEGIIKIYQQKLKKVRGHIDEEKKAMAKLLVKKRGIENVEVQQELGSKLKLAQGDLEQLDTALRTVTNKEEEFSSKKKGLEKQITEINNHMALLQGKTVQKGGPNATSPNATPPNATPPVSVKSSEKDGDGISKGDDDKKSGVKNQSLTKKLLEMKNEIRRLSSV